MCATCGFGEQCVNGACVMAPCGPMTCAGCCTNNFCVTPSQQNPFSCGSAGQACATCSMGESCINGACAPTPPCGPSTCSGCCANGFCLTSAQQSRFACGAGGQACTTCPMGQSCLNGTCGTPPPCNAMTCPTGCCENGQCQAGNSERACGTGGGACTPCGMGNRCVAGACQRPDGGMVTPVEAGAPCTSSMACQPPQGALCIQESTFGQPSGFPGGYCTAQCGPNQPCRSGVCVTGSVFGFSGSSCRASCSAPGGGQSTCRSGYVCTAVPGSAQGACQPRCTNGGLAACAMGQTCNATTGYCQ